MRTKWLWLVAAAMALAAATAVYAFRLGEVPAYVGLDEAHFANHAYSLATTGRDLNGNRLPLFISLEDPLGDHPVLPWGTTWYHPFGFYLIAAVLTVGPMTEWAIRLPIMLIGILDLLLMYAVAFRWYGSRRVALGAAALLAMTPAHFILSRVALDYLLPLPFTLVWLWALTRMMSRADRSSALVTGLVLGAGCFSYVASWLMMPLYLAITIIVAVRWLGRRELVMPLIGGFVSPLLLLALWVVFHPSMPANIISQYQMGDTRRSVVSAIIARDDVTSALRDFVSAYWSYFNPSLLMVTGGVSRIVSTGAIGVWPVGTVCLILIGVVRVLAAGASVREVILIAGVLTAPLPAALKGEPFAIQRAIALLPFGVLLATGALATMRSAHLWTRTLMVIALMSIPFQFSGFLRDYFGEYRIRSARALDVTAFRETAVVLMGMADGRPGLQIALTAPLYDVSAKWRFYCTQAGKLELLARTRYFSGALTEISDLPAGSVAVVPTDDLAMIDGWTRIASPASVSGDTPLTIVQRQ